MMGCTVGFGPKWAAQGSLAGLLDGATTAIVNSSLIGKDLGGPA